MRDLKIVNGDLSFIDYGILLVEGDLEEFKLDTSVGLESDNMFGKNYNEDYLKQDITEAILDQEPRINSIENIEIVRNNRQLNITVEMLSTLGDEVEVVIRA